MLSRVPSSFLPVTLAEASVLIVEDEPISRRAMAVLLSACGYRTLGFRSAEEALQTLDSGLLPRFALVDLDLPGMNGLELISRLERMYPQVLPVLITGTDEDNLARRLHGRAVTYLRKPVDFEMLLKLLAEHERNVSIPVNIPAAANSPDSPLTAFPHASAALSG